MSHLREIRAVANKSAKTFTLYTSLEGTKTKYRTNRMSKDEFKSCLYNTTNDWNQFLKSDEYYKVK